MRGRSARPGLREYYLLEGLNALGTNVFFLGVFFHARIAHGFSDTANLLLAATQGAAYVLATRAGGRFADRAGADRSIALGLAGMCLSLALGWLLQPVWGLFTAVAIYSASTALTWPALEAAIARAPGHASLTRRTGLYNVIWSFIGAAGFFLAGPLVALDPDTVFWAPLAAHALQLAALTTVIAFSPPTHGAGAVPASVLGEMEASRATRHERHSDHSERIEGVARRGGQRPARPPQPDTSLGRYHGSSAPSERPTPLIPLRGGGGAATAAVTPANHEADPSRTGLSSEAQSLYLRSAWIANGLNYFLFGAFSALAPSLGERLGLGPRLAIWLVSSYLFARSAAFVLFWRWEGWEYRRGWLAAALALPAPAFAVLFTTKDGATAISALALLGALSGLAYSASLHASLDREGGEGEGGGLHEWVIGLGILLGPLAGIAGVRIFPGLAGAGGLVTALGAAAALAGLTPLLRKRSRR